MTRNILLFVLALAGCAPAYAAPITGSKTDTLVLNPLASAPSCPTGLACLYARSSDNQIYDVDAAGLVLKHHAAKSFRTSSSCAGLASPANGDVCFDTSIPAFRFYNSGWSTAAADDALVVHKSGTETITGAKTFSTPVALNGASLGGARITALGSPTASTDAATKGYVDAAAPETWFSRTCVITSSSAATPVTCLADAAVGSRQAYLMGWRAKVSGATPWATTTTCSVKDTSGLATPFIVIPVAALVGNAFVSDTTSGVTQSAAYSLNQGTAATRGLVVVCDANGTGSDLVVTVFGSIK